MQSASPIRNQIFTLVKVLNRIDVLYTSGVHRDVMVGKILIDIFTVLLSALNYPLGGAGPGARGQGSEILASNCLHMRSETETTKKLFYNHFILFALLYNSDILYHHSTV